MIEPVTLGVVIAALAAKALDRAEDGVVQGGAEALGRMLSFLRERFSRENDEGANQALERLADAPDSPKRVHALAELLDKRAERSPEFRVELEALVEEARGAGVDIGSIAQTAIGDGNVQIAGLNNSQVNVNPASPHQPNE